jgi:asparagine synthase (glutamine-hydrolysing)
LCGICGIAGNFGSSDRAAQIRQMTSLLKHRGPDGMSVWSKPENPLALGHSRLAILDLNPRSDQPFHSQDGRYTLVFNGEIYNYTELREELINHGHIFKTSGDTEVALISFLQWDCQCFSRFRGMWAIAIYDSHTRELVLSRDPFGMKPLYWSENQGTLLFASEIKALLGANPTLAEPDLATRILFSLTGITERGDWTFYKNIKRFPPAHYARFSLSFQGFTPLGIHRYWPVHGRTNTDIEYGDAVVEMRRLFQISIQRHLRSDVPIGACLSGGLDSSAILCATRAQAPHAASMHAFTTTFPENIGLDEHRYAAEVARSTGSSHHLIQPTAIGLNADWESLVICQDEPFGSLSIYSQFAIFQSIHKQNIKVVFDGQGADEALAGYPANLNHMLAFKLMYNPKIFLREARDIKKMFPMNVSLIRATMLAIQQSLHLDRYFSGQEPTHTIIHQNKSAFDELIARIASINASFSSFEQYLEYLSFEGNVPALLRYEDRNSMHFGIESRLPFLDFDLMEFMLSLPCEYKIRGGYTKKILRDAMTGLVPDNIIYRKDKLGFPGNDILWSKNAFDLTIKRSGDSRWRNFMLSEWNRLVVTPYLSA